MSETYYFFFLSSLTHEQWNNSHIITWYFVSHTNAVNNIFSPFFILSSLRQLKMSLTHSLCIFKANRGRKGKFIREVSESEHTFGVGWWLEVYTALLSVDQVLLGSAPWEIRPHQCRYRRLLHSSVRCRPWLCLASAWRHPPGEDRDTCLTSHCQTSWCVDKSLHLSPCLSGGFTRSSHGSMDRPANILVREWPHLVWYTVWYILCCKA